MSDLTRMKLSYRANPTQGQGNIFTQPIFGGSSSSVPLGVIANPLLPTRAQRVTLRADLGTTLGGIGGGALAGAIDGMLERRREDALAMWRDNGGLMDATTELGENPWANADAVATFSGVNPTFPPKDPSRPIPRTDLPLLAAGVAIAYGFSGLPGRNAVRYLGNGMAAYWLGDLARTFFLTRKK